MKRVVDNDAEDSAVTRFLAAWFEVRQFIQAANFNHFHKAGLSATQFMILNILPTGDGSLSIGELAKRMNLKPATIAKTVDTLEERKMLTRDRSEADGRRILLRITREGKQLQNAAAGHFRAQISSIFRAIPNADREALLQGLESFARASATEVTRVARGAPPEKRNSRQSRRP